VERHLDATRVVRAVYASMYATTVVRSAVTKYRTRTSSISSAYSSSWG
jgi:hypothetical protein